MPTNPLTSPEISNIISESDLEKKIENLSLKDSSDLEAEKQKNTASEKVVEEFAERLGIKEFTENKEEWKKFYIFAGSDFVWPSTMIIGERREVFDYIIYPDWEPIGEELARNTIGYRCLLESGTLDKSKGTHILIIHGKLVEYGDDKSPEEEEELDKKISRMLLCTCR